MKYTIHIQTIENCLRDIAKLLARPVDRPIHHPLVWHRNLLYQAESWNVV